MSMTVRASFDTLSAAEAAATRLRAEGAQQVNIVQQGNSDTDGYDEPDPISGAASSLFGSATMGIGFPSVGYGFNASTPAGFLVPGDRLGAQSFDLEATVPNDAYERVQSILDEIGGND